MNVAILDDYQHVAARMADWSRLGEAPYHCKVTFFHDTVADRELDGLVKRLDKFEVIVAMRERTPFPRTLLTRLPKLKLLITTGPRNASFDMQAAQDLGIAVAGTRMTPHDLSGKTLGLFGLGRLGSQVARVGLAFNMNVLAWSPNLTAAICASAGVELASSLEDLLKRSDYFSVHVVLGDRSRGVIGRRELGWMKKTAYLVNTSRGPIIDENALVEALVDGTIAGAGLDTFDIEPLPVGHILRTLPNTVLTPHIGYVVESAYKVAYSDALATIIEFVASGGTVVKGRIGGNSQPQRKEGSKGDSKI
ncbi:hypothetical protein HDU93_001203 [Gonapodya sp. JEL0774]|nr:hypothetical protein HDU93_001203 [Gonapodya sp. JEL0774]